MKIKLHNLLKYIALGLAVLSLIFMACPGIIASQEGVSTSVALAGLIFGNGKIVTKIGQNSASASFKGGMSIFGLISFLVLVAAIVIMVVAYLKNNKKLALIGAGLAVLAGILIFLLKVCGTNVALETISTTTLKFKDFVEGTNLGVGTILYGVFAILSGASYAAGTCLEK